MSGVTLFRPAVPWLLVPMTLLAVLAAGWASQAAESPPEGETPPGVALLPMQNRSGAVAPMKRIQTELAIQLGWAGVSLLDGDVLEDFMRRHRMRHVGGINGELARALGEETGARAVLIIALDLYSDRNPPKAAFTARLVSTEEDPRILWMGRTSESGDAAPGFLGLGLVHDIDEILYRTVRSIAGSVALGAERLRAERGEIPQMDRRPPKRLRPKVTFSSHSVPVLGREGARIAVLPLANESTMPYAGEIVTDLVVREMVRAGLEVLEPGVLRHTLLETRLIQPKGPSVPQVGILDAALTVDRVVFGEVTEYRESGSGTLHPTVDFSIRVMDTSSRQVVWSSISHTSGDEKVFFFDVGRIPTAHELASRMAGALVDRFRRSSEKAAAGLWSQAEP